MMTRRGMMAGLGACAGCATLPAKSAIDDDEYALYNLLWSDIECRDHANADFVVIETETISATVNDPGIDRSAYDGFAIESFYARNATSHRIDPARATRSCTFAVFVTDAEAQEIAKTLDAGEIYREQQRRREEAIKALLEGRSPPVFESGLVVRTIHWYSRFGFNRERTRAIGARTYFCGPLCAGSYFLTAENGPDGWSFTGEELLWIS